MGKVKGISKKTLRVLEQIAMEADYGLLPGRYRHFKGNEYEVLYIARHSETAEPMVVYRALQRT